MAGGILNVQLVGETEESKRVEPDLVVWVEKAMVTDLGFMRDSSAGAQRKAHNYYHSTPS